MLMHLLRTSVLVGGMHASISLRSAGMGVHHQGNICSRCNDDVVSTSTCWSNITDRNSLPSCSCNNIDFGVLRVRTITITRRRLSSLLLWITINISSPAESLHYSCVREQVGTGGACLPATSTLCWPTAVPHRLLLLVRMPKAPQLELGSVRCFCFLCSAVADAVRCVLGEIQWFRCKHNLLCISFMILFSSSAETKQCGATNCGLFFVTWQTNSWFWSFLFEFAF